MVVAERRLNGADKAVSGLTPSLFVVATLIALLIVPFVVQNRVERLRTDIENAAEPAARMMFEAQYLLAREVAELRGFLFTGDSTYLEQYARFELRERQLYPELEALVSNLDGEVLGHVVELRTLSDQWHERVAVLDSTVNGDNLRELVEEELHLRTLESAGRADLALRVATAERRQEIRTVERMGRILYLLLAALAAGASLALATLNSRIRGLVAVATQRRTDAERALDESSRMAAARADLIRGFTHDVKNPLGTADGYAQILENGIRGELTADQLSTIGRIRRSIRGAVEITEQLLDLSRLEGGGLEIRRERVLVVEILKDIADRYGGVASAAGIALTVQGESTEGGPLDVYSDPHRIRQILDNLLTNALKYTPAGGRVEVGARIAEGKAITRSGRGLEIRVIDNGPGVPAEEVDRIFDEFHRVPGTAGRGHGLGLAISRRVARLLGGDVTVQSTLGSGSVFSVWLPMRNDGEGESVRG